MAVFSFYHAIFSLSLHYTFVFFQIPIKIRYNLFVEPTNLNEERKMLKDCKDYDILILIIMVER